MDWIGLESKDALKNTWDCCQGSVWSEGKRLLWNEEQPVVATQYLYSNSYHSLCILYFCRSCFFFMYTFEPCRGWKVHIHFRRDTFVEGFDLSTERQCKSILIWKLWTDQNDRLGLWLGRSTPVPIFQSMSVPRSLTDSYKILKFCKQSRNSRCFRLTLN